MISAIVHINASGKEAKAVKSALAPETLSGGFGDKVVIEVVDGRLELRFTSQNISGLRAALNSYIHWIDSVKNIVASTEE